jgi:PAT family beta-lactamase induction signal transducer AmpG
MNCFSNPSYENKHPLVDGVPAITTSNQEVRSKNILSSRRGRLAAFGILYISEGIPYGFSSTAMVAFMRIEGLSLQQIGAFVAAIFVPWSFKWLWAPMVDIIKLKRFGGRKAWITFCTSMMIATLVTVAFVDFVAEFELLLWMILLNNFFCATQDVAIDSLAVSTLRPDERATGNGIMFGGQYLGIGLGGGGAVFVSSVWGFNASLIYISILMLINLLFVLGFIHDDDAKVVDAPRRVSALSHFVSTLGAFVRDVYTGFIESGSGPRFGLLFALLPVGAMALAYALLGTIQVDYGLTEAQISQLSVTAAFTTGIGCVIGGMLGDRFGVKRVTATFYFMTAVPTLLLAHQIATVGLTSIALPVFIATILSHSLLFGMTFAVRNAIFMGMTNPAVAATQFTAYMALSNVAISIGNYWQGSVAERFNYQTALCLDAALIILALCVIPFLKDRDETRKPGSDTDPLAVAAAQLNP